MLMTDRASIHAVCVVNYMLQQSQFAEKIAFFFKKLSSLRQPEAVGDGFVTGKVEDGTRNLTRHCKLEGSSCKEGTGTQERSGGGRSCSKSKTSRRNRSRCNAPIAARSVGWNRALLTIVESSECCQPLLRVRTTMNCCC